MQLVESFEVDLDPGTYAWVDVRVFSHANLEASTDGLIKALINHPAYRDGYIGVEATEVEPRVHGPYWLHYIDPTRFAQVTHEQAKERFYQWVRGWGTSSEAVLSQLRDRVLPLLGSGEVRALLPMPEEAEHEIWTTAPNRFLEFIVISAHRDRVMLVVCTSD